MNSNICQLGPFPRACHIYIYIFISIASITHALLNAKCIYLCTNISYNYLVLYDYTSWIQILSWFHLIVCLSAYLLQYSSHLFSLSLRQLPTSTSPIPRSMSGNRETSTLILACFGLSGSLSFYSLYYWEQLGLWPYLWWICLFWIPKLFSGPSLVYRLVW